MTSINSGYKMAHESLIPSSINGASMGDPFGDVIKIVIDAVSEAAVPAWRVRCSHRYATANGFGSGYDPFEQGLDANQQLNYQTVLIPSAECVVTAVKARDLNNPPFNNVGDMFRAAHRYASGNGFATGFPCFEQGIDVDNDPVYGVVMLRPSIVDIRILPVTDLGSPDFGDSEAMIRASHRYARNLNAGYVSGFPLFEQGDRGGVLQYAIGLVKSTASLQVVLADSLGLCGRFSFDNSITSVQRNKLLERHCFAVSRIGGCGNLADQQKEDLRNTYRQVIKHGSSTEPRINASVPMSGPDARRRINVNFAVLFPQGDNEIAQTLIHEMMHCAGYTHPNRRPADQPGDNGLYYGTPPLQAEICIAGGQSLALTNWQQAHDCSLENGEFSMRG